jgi:hypothetical protein
MHQYDSMSIVVSIDSTSTLSCLLESYVEVIVHLVCHEFELLIVEDFDTFIVGQEFASLTSLFDLIDDLCQTGSSIRSIVIQCLRNQHIYEEFRRASTSDAHQEISHDIYEQQIINIKHLTIPLTLQYENEFVYLPIRKATCLLDELLFWTMKFNIPERLLNVLLILYKESSFRQALTPSFVNIYALIYVQWYEQHLSIEHGHCSRLHQLSVQVFSNSELTRLAIDHEYLIEIILSLLHMFWSSNRLDCQLQSSQTNFHRILSSTYLSSASYCSLIFDFVSILSHEYATRLFVVNKRYVQTWLDMISWFQG